MTLKADTKFDIIKKFSIIVLILFFSFPVYIMKIQTGLDQSWVYMLSESFDKWIFGKDIFFTYGPLGFLANAVPINNSKFINLFFNLCLFLYQGFLLYRYACYFTVKRVFWSGFLIFLTSIVFYSFSSEYYFEYIVLLSLNLTLLENKLKFYLYSISCFLILLAAYIKFNLAVSLLCVLVCCKRKTSPRLELRVRA